MCSACLSHAHDLALAQSSPGIGSMHGGMFYVVFDQPALSSGHRYGRCALAVDVGVAQFGFMLDAATLFLMLLLLLLLQRLERFCISFSRISTGPLSVTKILWGGCQPFAKVCGAFAVATSKLAWACRFVSAACACAFATLHLVDSALTFLCRQNVCTLLLQRCVLPLLRSTAKPI